ncbi:2-C-methyl-D-erythritol 4-phosphate cytidylyltransferase [Euhalothece natronophila Z-M001]|uniref:2-C-methyl-D-erythritol 4-phosphate cytidylyltransferase n=1 Tax=Euhalothece natronophila Z-M001 TaxID=522448 RepID=A0A5B8NP72_9CHRO|nr:2-C-methyl-D-erythritol 4-phosphate cytidylyltransferase [Euhalothece natronophila]QDZ40868.1 2-C-methyl-D-erythritol 4-phosphate cytidylyltransferase [Euhalothece natronophila Z-M001]
MHLLIPAAGRGQRMGSDRNKLLLPLLGKPLLAWTLLEAEASTEIKWIGIVGQSFDFPDFKGIIEDLNLITPIHFIEGGNTRQESVFNGLQALPEEARYVLIHDGARCLVTRELFDRCSEALNKNRAVIAGVPVKDTIKVVDEKGYITDTPDRSQMWAAQTPQGFEVELLKWCHRQGQVLGWQVTDDAALLERCQFPVKIVEGEETNLKLTTRVDLAIAQFILEQRQDPH